MLRFQMIYPEKRMVSEDFIRSWYADLLADGEIDDPGHEPSVFDCMLTLEDIGVATFADEHLR